MEPQRSSRYEWKAGASRVWDRCSIGGGVCSSAISANTFKIMKKFARLIILSLLCGYDSSVFPAEVGADSTTSLKVGAGEIDITPPTGHRMAGYFDERL